MPIYEYQCAKCGKVHEIWQKITEDPVKKCPDAKCKGKVERIISAVGFELKGGGWYKDGYASGKGAKSTDAAASDSSSDSTPAAKGDEKKPKKAQGEKAEKAAEVAAKNDKFPRTDPKHKSNSPKAK
jgi:putative FmdB family regulatory protein